ncbi:MAG: N-acetylmuramoyl-L-alanine amidase, partial [Gemmatimonadota bacterium]
SVEQVGYPLWHLVLPEAEQLHDLLGDAVDLHAGGSDPGLLDQGTHLRESVRFGGFIQNKLRDAVDSPDRGVRPGPYWVLVRATSNMPTVLVELGFITNASEERRLRDSGHQQTLARAIAGAIREYLADKSERLTALGAAE